MVAVVAAGSLTLAACGGGSGDSEAFCAELRSFVEEGTTSVDPSNVDVVAEQINGLLELAPNGAVRSALETVVAVTEELPAYIERISNANGDVESVEGISVSDEELQRADETIRDYATNECDLDLPTVDSTTAP